MFTVIQYLSDAKVQSHYRHVQIGEPSLNSERHMTKCDVHMFNALITCKSPIGMVICDRVQIDYVVSEDWS